VGQTAARRLTSYLLTSSHPSATSPFDFPLLFPTIRSLESDWGKRRNVVVEPSAGKRRGGRRPGAGAPKGNLNGLKHGRRSKQLAALGHYIAVNPRMRAILLHHAGREANNRDKVDRLARQVFANILERGIRVGKKKEQELNEIIEDMLE